MPEGYKRILLKVSGEALAGSKGMGIDYDFVLKVCESIKNVLSPVFKSALSLEAETSGEASSTIKWTAPVQTISVCSQPL